LSKEFAQTSIPQWEKAFPGGPALEPRWPPGSRPLGGPSRPCVLVSSGEPDQPDDPDRPGPPDRTDWTYRTDWI